MNYFYAYFIIYLGILFEGEIALLTASGIAQSGLLEMGWVTLAAFLSTMSADWMLFYIGRYFGKKIFEKFPGLMKLAMPTNELIHKYPRLILFLYRFLYGFRIPALLMLGVSNIQARRFIISSIVVIIIWVTLISLTGYYLGEFIYQILERYRYPGFYLAAFLLLLIIFVLIGRYVLQKAIVRS